MDAPTHSDLFLVARRQALIGANSARFDPEIIDTDGSDVNVLFNVTAAVGEEVARWLRGRLNAIALGTAKGDDLVRLIYDRYQLPKLGARSAVATVQLSRTGSTGFTVPKGFVLASTSGPTFVTQNDVAFAANNRGPLSVVVTAQQTGRAGNVLADTITRLISSPLDPTLVATNAEPAAGGRDEETEESFQARARAFYTAASRGTKEAIEFGALEVVAKAEADEILNATSGLAGYRVQLYIADEEGQANDALADEVEEQLLEFRCFGVPVQVVASTPEYIDISASGLQFQAGANTTSVLESAAAAVLAYVNTLGPGVTLRRADLLSVLSRTAQLIVPESATITPLGDVVPTTGYSIRTTRDRISLTG